MKHLTIKARIMLLCMLLAALVAAMALGAVLLNEQRMMEAYFRDSLSSTARLARDDIRSEGGKLEIDRNLDELPNVRVAIYNLDGDLIYGRQRFSLEFTDGEFRRAEGTGGNQWVLLDTRLNFDAAEGVWLRCYMSADAMASMRGFQKEVLLAIFPGLILLAALGGWLIAKRAFRPISRIIRTAEGIVDGADLKKRIRMSGGARDEIYQTAAVFDGMMERLEDAFERERQFTSDVSHELRTPVAAIMLQSEVALSENADTQVRQDALEEILRKSRGLSALIQRLLNLARLDAKQTLPEVERVDLCLLAEIAAQSLEERAKERGIHICVEADANAWVSGDDTMLTQALLNLAENGISYGKQGGHLWIRVKKAEDEIRLSVEDDGCGISPEHQKRIFDRFYQADASRSNRGFGLGLPLVKRIVQLHAGRMELHSEEGKGSCFEMILPAIPDEEDANA